MLIMITFSFERDLVVLFLQEATSSTFPSLRIGSV